MESLSSQSTVTNSMTKKLMGQLIDGVWTNEQLVSSSSGGNYVRQVSQLRNHITKDGSSGFPGVSGRYHLYVSLACPWAHRTLIMRKLKGLEDHISLSIVDPFMMENGWAFSDYPGSIVDTVNNKQYMHQVYTTAVPDYTGRVSVPLLWDKEKATAVSNESAEIILMFNDQFECGDQSKDFYPEALRAQIDEINEYVYENINNRVYQVGFATTQEAYEENFHKLFEALDTIEDRLSRSRYLVGDQFTIADIRLFTTLIRFDSVYFGHFKCNLRMIESYHNISNFVRDIYQMPGIADTINFHHIKTHYYYSHTHINPTQVVPLGPALDYNRPHDRNRQFQVQSTVTIKASTWSQDSYDTFDYEAENLTENRLQTTSSCNILRFGDQVALVTCPVNISELGSNSQLIAVLESLSHGRFSLKSDNNDLWIVVRFLPQEVHAIQIGDIIKLGNVSYKVKQFSMNQTEESQPSADSQCRICLGDDNSEEDPLIAPCLCTAQLEYMHYDCLRLLLQSRSIHSSHAYFQGDLNCEVCRTPFQLNWRGKCLIDIDMNSPHLILKTLDEQKFTHIITIQPEQVVRFGSGLECEVRINETSLSSCHAEIFNREGQFWLKDNLSKFGTLVKVQNSIMLESKHTIQVGRTVLTLELGKSQVQFNIQIRKQNQAGIYAQCHLMEFLAEKKKFQKHASDTKNRFHLIKYKQTQTKYLNTQHTLPSLKKIRFQIFNF